MPLSRLGLLSRELPRLLISDDALDNGACCATTVVVAPSAAVATLVQHREDLVVDVVLRIRRRIGRGRSTGEDGRGACVEWWSTGGVWKGRARMEGRRGRRMTVGFAGGITVGGGAGPCTEEGTAEPCTPTLCS